MMGSNHAGVRPFIDRDKANAVGESQNDSDYDHISREEIGITNNNYLNIDEDSPIEANPVDMLEVQERGQIARTQG